MKKNIVIPLLTIVVTAILLVIVRVNSNLPASAITLTPSPAVSLFSDEANEIFVSSITGNIDLNSGINMGSPTHALPEQINNVGFVVFNHTDEPILFSNQGFDLTVFRYDDIA